MDNLGDNLVDNSQNNPCVQWVEEALKNSQVRRALLVDSVHSSPLTSIVLPALKDTTVIKMTPADYITSTPSSEPYDLGIATFVFKPDEDSHKENMEKNWSCIARMRDLECKQLCVIMQSSHESPQKSNLIAEMTSMGLRYMGNDEAESELYFEFNIHDYKNVPDWFNSKYWAHPERWDKERW